MFRSRNVVSRFNYLGPPLLITPLWKLLTYRRTVAEFVEADVSAFHPLFLITSRRTARPPHFSTLSRQTNLDFDSVAIIDRSILEPRSATSLVDSFYSTYLDNFADIVAIETSRTILFVY